MKAVKRKEDCMKKIISILICLVLFLGAPVAASEEITVCLNGTPLEFDVPPQLINDRTMVPMRKIFEALGAAVDRNGENQLVTAVKGETVVQLTIGSRFMKRNETVIELDVPPQIVNDRTLTPVRAIAESFELDVDWKQQEKTVMITQRETDVPEKPDADNVSEVLFTSFLLPGDNTIYPLFMRDIALVDKNGTCYCAQTTLYRILTMARYGYRFVEIPNHPNFLGFDMAVDIPLGIEGGFSVSGTGKTGALFDKNDRGKKYLYSADGLADHAPAVWYGSRCYLSVTDVLDFFEIPYERVVCDNGNNVIIELKDSEDLKQIIE